MPGPIFVGHMDTVTSLSAALADRYTIEREIGRGGMATVYLARDVKHDRRVALKVLDPELAAVLGAERFLAEIRVTANLHHPNLLPLFDSGEAAGQLYYVMPFIEGETLRARLDRETQLPVDEAIRITVSIANALEYAHGHGVIHRDLKPENILLQAGQPVIADFGIALAVSNAGGERVTQTGLSLGTPQYMSPEQATGHRVIDARSDQYSLAAVLYEMLTGEPPHTGSNAQMIIARLLTEVPRPVEASRASVRREIGAAVLRALQKAPADRFESVRAFSDALQRLPTAQMESASVQPGRRRTAFITVAIVAAIAAGTAITFAMRRDGAGLDPSVVVVVPTSTGGDASLAGAAARVDDAIAQGIGSMPWAKLRLAPASAGASENAVSAAARAAGASIAATSSVLASGDSLQLRMRLIDAATGSIVRQLPAVTVARNLSAADAQHSTEQLVTALGFISHPLLGPVTLPSGAMPSLEAFHQFESAISALFNVSNADSRPLVITPLRNAVVLDSTFGQAKLWAGFAYEWYGQIARGAGGVARADTVARWIAAARRNATPYEKALADFVHENLGEQGDPLLEAMRRLLALAPQSPLAPTFPIMLEDQNRLHEAEERYVQLLAPSHKRDTLNTSRIAQLWSSLGTLRHVLGEYDASLAAWKKARELRPGDINYLMGQLTVLAAMGRLDEMNRLLPDVASATTNGSAFGFAGNAYLTVGNELLAHGHPAESQVLFKQAAAWFEQREIESQSEPPVRMNNNIAIRRALALVAVGRNDDAIVVLLAAQKNDTSDARAPGLLARIYADQGKTAETRAQLAWLEARPGATLQGTSTYERAAITTHLGRDHWDQAVRLLEESLRQGEGFNIRSRLHWFSDWLPLKDYPPFKKVLEPRG